MGDLAATVLSISILFMTLLSLSKMTTRVERVAAILLMICAILSCVLFAWARHDIPEEVIPGIFLCSLLSAFIQVLRKEGDWLARCAMSLVTIAVLGIMIFLMMNAPILHSYSL